MLCAFTKTMGAAVALGCFFWPMEPAHARDEPGAREGRASQLRQENRITQYGITWIFDRTVTVGQFINGDYYVVGPVKVVDIQPKPLTAKEVPEGEIGDRERARVSPEAYVRNGSMLNMAARKEVAFDSGIRNFFKRELLALPPVALQPGDSLISTISLRKGEEAQFPFHGAKGSREHHDNSPVRTAAVLTCVAEALPGDAFRPSYGDREQVIYYGRNIRRELLPRLKAVENTPDVETWLRVYERPWINPCFFGFEQPMENMPHYGQWVGEAQSMAGLLLMLDLPWEQKEELLIRVIQVGIDYWGLIRNGHPGWQGWGGHGSGRKFPIVFAGLLLGEEGMSAPSRTFPKVDFGEDNQTMHGKGWTGATALFAGHSGIQRASGKSERPHWGPYEHLHPSKWSRSQRQSEAYRRANTSASWVGQALVLRLLNAEQYWDHDAFFDYVDRWMTEPGDRENREEIMKHHEGFRGGPDARFAHQGSVRKPFVRAMWETYRFK
jgi:hypothetical protein